MSSSKTVVPIKFVKSTDGNTEEVMKTDPSVDEHDFSQDVSMNVETQQNFDALQKMATDDQDQTTGTAGTPTNLPAVMVLFKRFPDLKSSLIFEETKIPSETGPRPYFRCRANIMGQDFTGEGLTKKEAKQILAQRALSTLPESSPSKPKKRQASESVETLKMETLGSEEQVVQRVVELAEAKSKNPMQVLNEIIMGARLNVKPVLEYKQISGDEAKPHEYMCACVVKLVEDKPDDGGAESQESKPTVDGKSYESPPMPSKRGAMHEAVKKILEERFGVDSGIFSKIEQNQLKDTVQNKHPVQAMHELAVRRGMKITEEWPPTNNSSAYHVVFTITDRTFDGESTTSKKEAKAIAAVKIMKEIFGITMEVPITTPASGQSAKNPKRAIGLGAKKQFGQGAMQPFGQNVKQPFGQGSWQAMGQSAKRPIINLVPTSQQNQGQPAPLSILDRISTMSGVPVQYFDSSDDSQARVGVKFGNGTAEGYGSTTMEAKVNAASTLLQQLGIPTSGSETTDEEMQQGSSWSGDQSDAYWQDYYSTDPYASYRAHVPQFQTTRGRGAATRGGLIGQDYRQQFTRPL